MQKIIKINQKGITLVSLVVIIVVLLILASITTYNGKNAIDSSRLLAFSTQMKIMQAEINVMYQELKNGNEEIKQYGKPISNFLQSEEVLELANVYEPIEKDETLTEEEKTLKKQTLRNTFKYYTIEELKNIGIDSVNQELLINIENRIVVSCKGITYKNKTYYTLESLSNTK